MGKVKKVVSFLLCMAMIIALSVTAFADGGVAPLANRSDATHYIAGSNVNLRSGPGTGYSSGGLLQWYDECHYTMVQPTVFGSHPRRLRFSAAI